VIDNESSVLIDMNNQAIYRLYGFKISPKAYQGNGGLGPSSSVDGMAGGQPAAFPTTANSTGGANNPSNITEEAD